MIDATCILGSWLLAIDARVLFLVLFACMDQALIIIINTGVSFTYALGNQ